MSDLVHELERTVLINATRKTVFRHFTDSERFAAWWGPGSTIEGHPGGAIRIRYPDGTTASGQVLEIEEPARIVFSYGYDAPGAPIAPGASRVAITLEERAEGTLVRLRHALADAAVRDHHVQGWRYQLAVFANVAAREQHAGLAEAVDRYFELWSEPDAERRLAGLTALATPALVFRDAYGSTVGVEDLAEHVGASQVHMPGVRLLREGDVSQCQGTAVVEWSIIGPDGAAHGRGMNVFDLAPDGRITRVVALRKS